MLDSFVVEQRGEIISRAKRRVTTRTRKESELSDGIPAFLDQLVAALRVGDSGENPDHAKIRASAHKHGDDLFKMGMTIEEVVHEYGDVCQTISELAIEKSIPVPTPEFRIMNLCLDDAIAEAVTEFAVRRDGSPRTADVAALDDVAHELRNLLSTARTAFGIIKAGHVAPAGATGVVLDRSLQALADLVERAFPAAAART